MKVGVSGAGNHRRKNRKRFGWNLRRQQCQISKLSKCRQQFLSTWNYYQQGCLGVVKKKDGWMIGQWRYNDKQSGPHTTKIVHGLMRYWTGKKIISTQCSPLMWKQIIHLLHSSLVVRPLSANSLTSGLIFL